jgi:ATP-dependent helicase/nuclease subunit B
VAVRPRSLPVTAVETWVRDPYAVYARRILDLRPLDRPAKPFDNRGRGTAIHKAAELFAPGWPHAGRDPAGVFAAAYLQRVTEAGATRPIWSASRRWPAAPVTTWPGSSGPAARHR